MTKERGVTRVVTVTLLVNIVLAITKFLGGFLGNAYTLISDGFNSTADVTVSLMLLIVLKIANKKADNNHQYGHEKYEGIIHFVLGIVVSVTAVYIGITSSISLYEWFFLELKGDTPNTIAIIVAVIAIAFKGFLVFLNLFGYKKYSAPALKADSVNHIGDILATSVGLVGIFIAFLNQNLGYFDFIASIIIGVIILKAGVEILKEAISFLVDEAPSDLKSQPIKDLILKVPGVIKIDDFKARKHVTRVFIDVEISLNGNLSLFESHRIAESVHESVEKEFEEVKHITVHVNPSSISLKEHKSDIDV